MKAALDAVSNLLNVVSLLIHCW